MELEKNVLNYALLCVMPLALFVLLFVGSKRNTEENKNEYLSLSKAKALQGFAAVGVLFHHLSQHLTNYGKEWFGPFTVFNWTGILFTSIFFFFSGYGLMVSIKSKPAYLKGFFRKRFSKVAIPFYESNILFYLVFVVILGDGFSFKSAAVLLSGVELVNSNTWFLIEIMILYVAFFLSFRWIKNKKLSVFLVILVDLLMITVSLLLGHEKTPSYGSRLFMGHWWYNSTITFVLGLLVGLNAESISEFLNKNVKWLEPLMIVAAISAFVLEIYVYENIGYHQAQELEGNPCYPQKLISLLAQSFSCIVFICMVIVLMKRRRVGNPIIDFFGKMSLEIYVFHGIVETVFEKYIPMNTILQMFLIIVISIIIAIPLNLLNQKLNSLILSKGRRNK